MRYINHKSDFQVIINIKDKEGNIVAPPSVPWEAVFSDENCVEFKCYFDGTNYTHCIVDGNDIVCFVDNPGFSCGNMRCTFCQHVPSAEYCDGVMDLTQPLQCDIMLSKRESDDSTPITIEASPNWAKGEQGIQGIQGEKGADGFSPIVSLTKQGEISTLSITDVQGEHTTEIADGAKGDDGFSPIVSLSKVDKVTTLTITDAQGTHTATVNDGESVNVVQSTGNSTTSVMSQKSVSDALSTKVDKTELDSYATKEYVQTNAPNETKESIEEKLGAWLEEDGGEADGEVYTKAEIDALLSGNVSDDVYMVTSSSLADAVAEVPLDDRKVGLVIGLPGEGSSLRRYKYMGKYYTDVDWFSEGAWLDLDNADKYKVYYFRLCPTIDGHVDNASINSSGEVTTGTKHVTDFIEIPESGVSIGGGFYSRYTLYDSGKNKVSTDLLYGGKAFTYSTTESAFIRLEYETNTPVWLFGYARGSSSAEAPSLPHVEVIEDFENLIDYNDNTWAGNVGPFIRLRKGETINLLERGSDTDLAHQYFYVQPYNINQEPYGNAQSSQNKYVMPIDGYVKIGGGSKPALKNARYNIISKSIARTRAKKRLLVVGDSISVYTYDNNLSKDMIQGYPFFLATQGNHELSVTNQAVSGNESGRQLTTLQDKDVSVYDAVTIFIGTNDYGYNNSIATFKSNIAAMVDYITAQNPACKIGFFTLIHRASAWDGTAEVPNVAGAVLSDYCTAIKEVAMTYGLPVLDLWNECQCNFNFSIYKTNYSSHESEASGDGLHPTNEAHKLFLYPLVREFVKKLL